MLQLRTQILRTEHWIQTNNSSVIIKHLININRDSGEGESAWTLADPGCLLAARVSQLCFTDIFGPCCAHSSFKYGASLCSASQQAESGPAFPKMSSLLSSCPHSCHPSVPPRLDLLYLNHLLKRKSHHFSLQ